MRKGECMASEDGEEREMIGATLNSESSRRTVGEKRSVPESTARKLEDILGLSVAQALGFSRAEVRGCELLRVDRGLFVTIKY